MAVGTERGYYTGMLDVYVAKLKTEDTAAAAPTYDTPQMLGMGIEVTITPQYREGALHASNRAVRRQKLIDRYEVKCNTDALKADVLAMVLGRTTDGGGVQVVGGGNRPPEIALGFVRTRDDGSKEYWWLLKGKMQEGASTAKTSEDNIEYQTPTLEGTFDRRIFDDALAVVADSDDKSISAATLSGWFGKVYEPTAAAAAK